MRSNNVSNRLKNWFIILVVCWTVKFGGALAEVSLDARSIGLGGQLSSGSYGAAGLFNNPATISELNRSDFSYDFSQTAIALTYPIQIRGQKPFYLGAVGIGLTDLLAYDRFFSSSLQNPIGMQMWGDNQLVLTIARSMGGKVHIGANFSFRQHLYLTTDRSIERSFVYPYDIGLILRPSSRVSIGLAYHHLDLNAVYDNPNIQERQLIANQSTLRLGQSADRSSNLQIDTLWHIRQPNDGLQMRLRSGLDIRTSVVNDWRWRAGGEIGQYGLWLRSGFAQQLIGTPATPQPRFSWRIGASIERFDTTLHYAYQHNNRDYQHHLSLNFAIGQFIRRNVITQTGRQTKNSPFQEPKTEQSLPKSSKKNNVQNQKKKNISLATSATTKIAARYQLPVEYLVALVKTESSFISNAISASGAVGLGQLMAPTARDLGLRVPDYNDSIFPNVDPQIDQRFDARKNLEASAKYLQQMLNRYNGNYALALAAYNAGPGRVKSHIPLIRETERYVGKVLNAYYQYQANPSLKVTDLHKLDKLLR